MRPSTIYRGWLRESATLLKSLIHPHRRSPLRLPLLRSSHRVIPPTTRQTACARAIIVQKATCRERTNLVYSLRNVSEINAIPPNRFSPGVLIDMGCTVSRQTLSSSRWLMQRVRKWRSRTALEFRYAWVRHHAVPDYRFHVSAALLIDYHDGDDNEDQDNDRNQLLYLFFPASYVHPRVRPSKGSRISILVAGYSRRRSCLKARSVVSASMTTNSVLAISAKLSMWRVSICCE